MWQGGSGDNYPSFHNHGSGKWVGVSPNMGFLSFRVSFFISMIMGGKGITFVNITSLFLHWHLALLQALFSHVLVKEQEVPIPHC